MTDFIQHTRNMHANSDDGFSAEFEEICNRTRTDLSAEASYLPENKAKNRYVNISACKCVHYLISFPGPTLDIKYLSPIFHKTSCLRVNKCKYYWYCQILCEQQKFFVATLLDSVPMVILENSRGGPVFSRIVNDVILLVVKVLEMAKKIKL